MMVVIRSHARTLVYGSVRDLFSLVFQYKKLEEDDEDAEANVLRPLVMSAIERMGGKIFLGTGPAGLLECRIQEHVDALSEE